MALSLPRAMTESIDPRALEQARTALVNARAIAVLTGAGISAESGIPTFRDAMSGLWSRFRPEDLATPEAFQRDPKTVWEWYAWRFEVNPQRTPLTARASIALAGASGDVLPRLL